MRTPDTSSAIRFRHLRPTGGSSAPFWEWYDPDEVRDPPIYMRFAEVAAVEDQGAALDAFCGEFGRLGGEAPEEEARDLAAMVRVWTALQSGDAQTLAEFVRWKGAAVTFTLRHGVRLLNTWPSPLDEQWEAAGWPADPRKTWHRGSMEQPARLGFMEVLNRKLAGAATPQMLPSGISMERVELDLLPTSLIGFMWIQFASEVTGGASFRKCVAPGCGRIFTPAYRNRKTCSDACRQRLAYHRQKGGTR
mgnify:FL=1